MKPPGSISISNTSNRCADSGIAMSNAMKPLNTRGMTVLIRSEHGRRYQRQIDRLLLAVGDRKLDRVLARGRQKLRIGPRAGFDVAHRDGVVVAREQPRVEEIIDAGTHGAEVARLHGPADRVLGEDDDEGV